MRSVDLFLEAFQRFIELSGGLKSLFRIAFERCRQDVRERDGHTRVHLVCAWRERLRHLHQLDWIHDVIRASTRGHLEQDDPDAVQIAALIGGNAKHLLGCHVSRRTGARYPDVGLRVPAPRD